MNEGINTPHQDKFLFEPFSPEFARNPYAVYKQMRESNKAYYYQDWDMWLFSSYDDVQSLATDSRCVRSLDHLLSDQQLADKREAENWVETPNFSRYVRVNILDSEGEMHDRLRRLVFKLFTPSKVNGLRSEIQNIVDHQLTTIEDTTLAATSVAAKQQSAIDFIADIVAPIPGQVIGKILGVPLADCDRLGVWSDNIVQIYEQDRSAEDLLLAEQATTEFATYLLNLASQRDTNPQADLISELVSAQAAGRLNQDELVATCMILLMAGHGSSIDASGNGMLALLNHPQQMEKLRREPSLINTAVQEMFRYNAPLPFFHRFISEDMEIGGQTFSKGTKIGLMYGAANRDPKQFSNANKFDISRSPNRHLAFGRGAHFCLGNHLARLNMEVIFTTMLNTFSKIELANAKPAWKRGITVRGLQSLPILLNWSNRSLS